MAVSPTCDADQPDEEVPAPAPVCCDCAGGGGFLTSGSRPAPTTASSRLLSTSAARGEPRSWTQYEPPSATTSRTIAAGVAASFGLRSIVIVAVGCDASRLGSAGAVSSSVAA